MSKATTKTYSVTVRIVPFDAPAFDTKATAHGTNAGIARANAERIVRRDYPKARAVVGIAQRRVNS